MKGKITTYVGVFFVVFAIAFVGGWIGCKCVMVGSPLIFSLSLSSIHQTQF